LGAELLSSIDSSFAASGPGKVNKDMLAACKFCHDVHPFAEQQRLQTAGREEYPNRHIDRCFKSSPQALPRPSPSNATPTSVADFINFLKQVSFNTVFQFATALYCNQPAALCNAGNDIRKYLFHISRHTAVITGSANVAQEGVIAGIVLFRVAAHFESIPDIRFKNLARQYVSFLQSVIIHQVKFDAGPAVIAKLGTVFFPQGLTFLPPAKDAPTTQPAAERLSPQPVVGKGQFAINVRELHRRKLCVACRHYLRGMCYRGDLCNFCHDPSHQVEHEQTTAFVTAV
jgi:hypothetical protein